eukprot:69081_1
MGSLIFFSASSPDSSPHWSMLERDNLLIDGFIRQINIDMYTIGPLRQLIWQYIGQYLNVAEFLDGNSSLIKTKQEADGLMKLLSTKLKIQFIDLLYSGCCTRTTCRNNNDVIAPATEFHSACDGNNRVISESKLFQWKIIISRLINKKIMINY